MKNYPGQLVKGILRRRINRFVAEVTVGNTIFNVYVPNTGRLSELAIPGADILLSEINTKYRYKILYIINRGFPVMIDSTYSNRIFRQLLDDRKVPLPFIYNSVKNEPPYNSHRFDFLLRGDCVERFIELKSCTLFHKTTGAFPDAVSSRASEHVRELASSGIGNLVFLVMRSDIEKFIPNYHTDYHFYRTIRDYRERINPRAYTVQYDSNLKVQSLKEIPVVIPEVSTGGVYMIVIHNTSDQNDSGMFIRNGYYIFCGEDYQDIFRAVATFRKRFTTGKFFYELDHTLMKIIADVPIVDESVTTDFIRQILKVHRGADVTFTDIDGAGIDAVYFSKDPTGSPWFWNSVLEMRFGKYN